MLVGFPLAVSKQAFGIAVLPALSDGIGEPLTDFDGAGLVVLAVKGQGRARQIRIAVLPITARGLIALGRDSSFPELST